MEKIVYHSPEKLFLLGAKKFFFKNWPTRFDNGFLSQKTLNKIILFHLDRKGFYSFCFSWWKPLLKLGRIKFLKNNLPVIENRGIQFLKSNIILADGDGF